MAETRSGSAADAGKAMLAAIAATAMNLEAFKATPWSRWRVLPT
jgi:hypothetical protein